MNIQLIIISLLISLTQPLISQISNTIYQFQEKNGIVAVEAEHFHQQEANGIHQWYVTSPSGNSISIKDDEGAHFENASGKSYLKNLPDTRLKNQWTLFSKQRTPEELCGGKKQINLDIPSKGRDKISFFTQKNGFEFDKFILHKNDEYPIGAGSIETYFANVEPQITGELKKWHKVTLTFDGPETGEQNKNNPFLNYRLNAYFVKGNKSYKVPGYFAADGNAGETSASAGNKWRIHFTPDEEGEWEYRISFRKGKDIIINDDESAGESASFMDGMTGSFNISPTDKTGRDFRAKGRLQYVGEHYLKFAETGEYFLKTGADAPENLLAYADFDGNFKSDGHKDHFVKTWEAHTKDWKEGDPTWKNGKGKGLIGAINYLASKGMNAFSFLTCNIKGDDQNVFPYTSYEVLDRMDVSKLDQWEIIFEHAQKLGLFLHFKTLEVENQGLHDEGEVGIQRQLYYRELIARFGHHLALNWNLCEENGKWAKNNPTVEQFTPQRIAMTKYFYQNDPYHHHLVIHNGIPFYDLLGNNSKLTGVSLQTHHKDFHSVHREVLRWRRLSAATDKKWVICVDEPGDAEHSLLPDNEDPEHNDARKNALWGALMAGSAGLEWYFGYKHDHSDLTCQDWRSRDIMWDQNRYALQFFIDNKIPFWEMIPDDDFTGDKNDYVFYKPGEIYVIYLKEGGAINNINMRSHEGLFEVSWFNPRTGKFTDQKVTRSGYSVFNIPQPSTEMAKDWVILMKKI